jgi:septal ring factor EnvC (AmiA/AmiB activator)
MSKFGKVLVVLLLLLSAVFAGSQMVLYAKRVNYYRLYQDEHKQVQNLEQSKQSEIALRESKLRDLDVTISRHKTEIGQLNGRIEGLQADVKRAETSKTQLEVANKELRDSIDKQTKLNESLNKDVAQLNNVRRQLEKTSRDQMGEIAQLKTDTQEKTAKINDLDKKIAGLEKVKTDLNDALKSAEAKIARYVALGVALPEADVPVMDARVLKVDNELKVVVLSAGKDDGVRVAHDFVVYRGDTFVGVVRVNFVSENTSVAQPVLVSKGEQIRIGDAATTRIQ